MSEKAKLSTSPEAEFTTPEDGEFKTCSRCKEELPATDEFFYRKWKKYRLLESQCIACRMEYNQTPRRKAQNRQYARNRNRPNKASVIDPELLELRKRGLA